MGQMIHKQTRWVVFESRIQHAYMLHTVAIGSIQNSLDLLVVPMQSD